MYIQHTTVKLYTLTTDIDAMNNTLPILMWEYMNAWGDQIFKYLTIKENHILEIVIGSNMLGVFFW